MTATKQFRFSGWNPIRGTVPAYQIDLRGLVNPTEVVIGDQGEPVDGYGDPWRDDNTTVKLRGWPHRLCQSFGGGRLLVPLRTTHD